VTDPNTFAAASTTADHGPPRSLPWVLLLFIGSGCAALIYEIVWLQMLQLVIGLTSTSLGVLLGTFMGGMCLGSLLLPRFIGARHHPLRVYALLELGIGAFGIANLFLVPAISRLYSAYYGGDVTGVFLRSGAAALCLLPSTVLMGATLPAIARWVESTRRGISWLGFFYSGNIVGAVFGCLFAGFYLLRVHDMATATYFAAVINGLVALTGFVLASFTDAKRDVLRPSLADPTPSPMVVGQASQWPAYIAIALSGLTALGAETVWTRLLSLTLGGTVYTFSIILAMFLVGLGIGSGGGSLLARSGANPRLSLGCCQLLLCVAVAWTAFAIGQSLPYWPVNPSLSRSPWFMFQLDLARCLWAVLPGAILWGASFPLALAAVAGTDRDAGKLAGKVYAANTVGAIIGALGFSLVAIPQWGTQWAERLLLGISVASGLILLAPAIWRRPAASSTGDSAASLALRFARASLIAVVLGLATFLAWRLAPAPWGVSAYGRFMASYGDRLAAKIVPEAAVPPSGSGPDIYCTFLAEGLNGTVAVTKTTGGIRSFHSAGKVQASNEPHDMRLQRLLGHLSALSHQKPESVLVVACGAGVTAGTFVLHPEVKRIVICDIEPLVPKLVAPMFQKENYGVIKDARTQVVLDDGRHFIRTTREKFDIITSDPVDPWVKGCAALNTVEYYEMCKAHLRPGGVMTLWIPLYESNPATVKSLVATFFQVFPNGLLWSNDADGEGYDAILFGQAEPTRFDLDAMQARLNSDDHTLVKQSLKEVGFSSAMSLLATYAGQAQDLGEWMKGAQINTDRNMRLQYLAGMALNSHLSSEILADIRRYYKFPDALFVGSDGLRKILKLYLQGSDAVPAAQRTEKVDSEPAGIRLAKAHLKDPARK
jgi:spermidine synthase